MSNLRRISKWSAIAAAVVLVSSLISWVTASGVNVLDGSFVGIANERHVIVTQTIIAATCFLVVAIVARFYSQRKQ